MKTLHIGSDTYRMDVFPLPAISDTNPLPIDIAIGGGKAWLSCEFDRRIYHVPTTAVDGTTMTAVSIPAPVTPIFRTLVFRDAPTQMSQCEDIDVDANGNVWIAQAGATPYNGGEDNASRVLRYAPATGKWNAYPIPWNNPCCGGVLIDGTRVWTTCGEVATGAALCVTRPMSWMNADTDPTKVNRGAQGTEFGGWQRIPYAGVWPSHMAISPVDGRLYITNYWGSSVSAVDRTTLAMQTYPLPVALPGANLMGSRGPWQLVFDAAGALWVTLDYSRELAKLNPTDGTWTIHPTGILPTENPHSLAIETVTGNVWFTAYSHGAGGRIGRRRSNGAVELSEPLDSFGLLTGATGCAFDPAGRLWVALFGSKTVGRLTKA